MAQGQGGLGGSAGGMPDENRYCMPAPCTSLAWALEDRAGVTRDAAQIAGGSSLATAFSFEAQPFRVGSQVGREPFSAKAAFLTKARN